MKTADGEISGRALIVATNAYSGEFSKSLVPDVAHEVMPVLSWQMATEPLSDAARKDHHPRPAGDVGHPWRALFRPLRRPQPLVTGGAIANTGDAAARLKDTVGKRLQRLWPQIGPVKFDYVWNGYVGMTTDFLPRIHSLGPDAWAWTGCNGRAVALSISIGHELSKAAQGVAAQDLALPFTEPVPYVAHALLRRLAPLMLMVYRRRDAAEIPEVASLGRPNRST